MQAFDKYVEIILRADNIEERWKLSEFFSTVTPTDRLREKWIEYKTLIHNDYDTFKQLKSKETLLKEEFSKVKSIDIFNKLIKVKKQLEPFERKLTEPLPVKPENTVSVDLLTPTQNVTTNNKTTDPVSQEEDLKKFKEEIQISSLSDTRYKMDLIFKKANELNNEVVRKLLKELGDPYQDIQTGFGANFKESTFSNKYGIQSKFDSNKQIWPTFLIKYTEKAITVTMTENNSTETFNTPTSNPDWASMKIFLRNYFLKKLNQLK